MKTVRLMVSGYGRVGRAFVELLCNKRGTLVKQYGLDVWLTAVVDLDGAAIAPEGHGLPLDLIVGSLSPGVGPSNLPEYGHAEVSVPGLVDNGVADVLVETTPTNIRDGEPGMTHITAALKHGLHVVTAAKGPLVLAFHRLHQLAAQRGASIKFSAATAAALPALDVGAYCLTGARILRIEGILNGTTNFILNRMQESGEGYEAALAEAQWLGIAETDPSLDVQGWDAASKLVLLANALLGAHLTLGSLEVSGIQSISPQDVRAAAARGKVLKLVALAEAEDGSVHGSVRVRELSTDHSLAHVMGAEKAVTYTTDTMDRVTVLGGKSDPRGAAAAILKDLIHLARKP